MPIRFPEFATRLANSDADFHAVQVLRYKVFVEELGGSGTGVDHERQIESDPFDAFCDHLMLSDPSGRLVGVYRLMTNEMAEKAGGFYSESEFDVSGLMACGRPLLELGRSCLHKDFRGGAAMLHLWAGVADYVSRHDIEIMFGVASFHGTDLDALAGPLSLLSTAHSSQDLICTARKPGAVSMNILASDEIDRKAAIIAMPTLIKAYLRLGGVVGQGAFVDHAFNTTDVMMIVDIAKMDPQTRAAYSQDWART